MKEYKLKLSGEIDKKFINSIDNLGGKVQELEDHKIVLSFNENKEIKNFKQLYNKIIKNNPDIPIQFKYDINIAALEAEKKKLEDMELLVHLDEKGLSDELNRLGKQALEIQNRMNSMDNIDSGPYKELEHHLSDIMEQFSQIKIQLHGMNKDSYFNSLSSEIKEIYNIAGKKRISIVDDKKILSQKKLIEDLLKVVTQLEKNEGIIKRNSNVGPRNGSGNSSGTGIDERNLQQIEDEIDNLKNALSEIREKYSSIDVEINSDSINTIKDINSELTVLKESLESIKNNSNIELSIKNLLSGVEETINTDILNITPIKEWSDYFLEQLEQIRSTFATIFNPNIPSKNNKENSSINVNNTIDTGNKSNNFIDELNNMFTTIKEIGSSVKELREKDFNFIFNQDSSAQAQHAAKKEELMLKQRLSKWENYYNQMSTIAEKYGHLNLLTSLWSNSSSSSPELNSYKNNYEGFFQNFDLANITQLSDLQERIQRIYTLVSMVKDVAKDNYGDPYWDDLSKAVSSFPVSALENIRKSTKEIYDIKNNQNNTNPLNIFGDINIESLSTNISSLTEVISSLNQVLTKSQEETLISNENSSISSLIDPSIFDSLITKINKELNPVIQQIGTAFSNEKIAADYAIDLEIKDLQELSKEITEIINKINKKSDAFKKEAGVVRHWVPIENEELLILKKTLGDITHYLKELEGLSKIDLSNLKLPKESPKIANAATKADNPIDANKQKGREPVKGLKNTYSKEELNIRTKAVYDEISLTEAKIKEMGGEVTTINTFFDSEENLVKAMVKATRTLDGKIENASYSIGYSFPKYDKSGNMIQEGGAFTSNINSDDYKTIEKRQEKENKLIARNQVLREEIEIRKKISDIEEEKIKNEKQYSSEIKLRDQLYDEKLKNETKILQLQLDSNKSHENEIQALIEKNKQLKEEISLHQKNAELINEEAAIESKSQKRKEVRNVYSSFKDLEESKKNDKAKNVLNNISNKYKSLEETFQKIDFSFGPKNKRNLKYIEEVSNEIAVLKEQINSVKENTNNIQLLNEDELKNLLETLEKIEQKEKQIKSYKNNVNYQVADEETIYKQITDIDKLLAKNDRMSKELKASFQDLKIRFANMINSNKPESELEDLIVEFRKLESEMQEAGNTGVKFTTLISKRIRGMSASFIAQWLSLYDIIRYIRQSASTIIQLDDALVDLSKTTKMSSSELTEFYYNANRLAKEMGVTTAEIINQASAFSRLGFSSKEASEAMAELSSKFASISPDMDVSTATDGLVSVMKAFDVEVEDVERKILDNINIVGNTAATSNGEIVDMLMRSSAAMKEANNSLEETIALETAAVEITRNAETTGTAFKTNNCLYVQKCA